MAKHHDSKIIATSSDHDRGDGHPSSLDSHHHLDQEGRPVYSTAQKAAIRRMREMSEQLPEAADEERPIFLDHVNPAHSEPERVETQPEPEPVPEPGLEPEQVETQPEPEPGTESEMELSPEALLNEESEDTMPPPNTRLA